MKLTFGQYRHSSRDRRKYWRGRRVRAAESAKRNLDAEIQAALESAKTAAGFENLGTLVRTCLLPQSGGENPTDTVPGYITNPASAPARDTWFAEPAKVFDNLYFLGGKLHSAWGVDDQGRDHLDRHDLSLQLGRTGYWRHAETRPRSEDYQVCSHLPRPW